MCRFGLQLHVVKAARPHKPLLLLFGRSKLQTAFENDENRLCGGCTNLFTSLADASFLSGFTVYYKSVRQGENIIRALPGHSSSLQALHEY